MKNKRLFNFATISVFSVISFGLLVGLSWTGIISESLGHILALGAINTIVALSLNIITGFTGQLALGQAGFMMVGAYSTAIFIMRLNVPLFIAIIMGGLVTAVFGFIIGFPTLRLRGDYLAITTLGFGEILRVVINYFEGLTGGASGLKDIPGFDNNDYLMNEFLGFVWSFAFLFIIVIAISNLKKSSTGRAIISIKEDEIASNSMGINVAYYKMFSFVFASFIAGIGGGLYAIFNGYLTPTNAGFMSSVYFVIYVVFGGLGSITGTIISTFFLTYLQDALQIVGDYRLVIFPLLLIIIMIFWPRGIMGNKEFSITDFVWKLLHGELFKKKSDKTDKTDKTNDEGMVS